MKTTAHKLIERELNFKLSTLSDAELKIYQDWELDQSDYLELSDSAMAKEIEDYTLALSQIKSLEKDSSELDKLKDSFQSFKKAVKYLED
jgi:hypothetical protein